MTDFSAPSSALPLLHGRFRGALLGFAVGDALGFPLRGLPPQSMARMTMLAEDFAAKPRGRFQKGQFSDDTQMLLAAVAATVQEKRIDGRATAWHLAQLWLDGVILLPPAHVTASMQRILSGAPWIGSGADAQHVDVSCLSRGILAGLFCEASPPKLAHDVQILTVITHKSALCAAATTALARAIQLGLSQETRNATQFCRQVATAAAVSAPALADEIDSLPRLLHWDEDKALRTLSRIGFSAHQADLGQGLPDNVTNVLLTALYAALRAGSSFRQAVSLVLRAGGEVDVAAGLTGAIVGAHAGIEAVGARLRKNILYREALCEAADSLFVAWSNLPGQRAQVYARSHAANAQRR